MKLAVLVLSCALMQSRESYKWFTIFLQILSAVV